MGFGLLVEGWRSPIWDRIVFLIGSVTGCFVITRLRVFAGFWLGLYHFKRRDWRGAGGQPNHRDHLDHLGQLGHLNHPNHLDHLDHIDHLDQVPLCQVNLADGEQQWRLLHRMTGPRDQVIFIIIKLNMTHFQPKSNPYVYLSPSTLIMIGPKLKKKIQPKIANWTDQLPGLGKLRFKVVVRLYSGKIWR